MGEGIDWRHRGDYIVKHGLTPELANEAFADPNRLVIDPDPASVSGRTIRVPLVFLDEGAGHRDHSSR